MATYTRRVTQPIGGTFHSYAADTPSPGVDTFTTQRFYTSFDLTAYSGGNAQLAGTTDDGTLIETNVLPSGDTPPTEA